jgi:hypothetical protein
MLQTITDLILNRQWSIAVGLAATGLAFAVSEYADAVPVELAPVLAALITWLRVWSNASVDDAVAAVQVDDPVT